MIDLIDVAMDVQRVIQERNWQFCFIGGLAVQQWGEPRLTRDVDLSLLVEFGQEETIVQELLRHFQPRIPDCVAFALRNRVVLLQVSKGIGIDIALAGLPFEAEMIRRSIECEILPGQRLVLCTAEDLIVLKAFAARPVDWHDVQSIVDRQGREALDWSYIRRQLEPLVEAKESPEILYLLDQIIEARGG